MEQVIAAVRSVMAISFETHVVAVNCHHNYVQREQHYGETVWLTRKGAVSAQTGQLGRMGARSTSCAARVPFNDFEVIDSFSGAGSQTLPCTPKLTAGAGSHGVYRTMAAFRRRGDSSVG